MNVKDILKSGTGGQLAKKMRVQAREKILENLTTKQAQLDAQALDPEIETATVEVQAQLEILRDRESTAKKKVDKLARAIVELNAKRKLAELDRDLPTATELDEKLGVLRAALDLESAELRTAASLRLEAEMKVQWLQDARGELTVLL